MNTRILLGPILVSSLAIVQAADAPAYLTPPQAIVDVVDAAPLPGVVVSPSRDVVAVTYGRRMPTIAELAEPMLRLAGSRISPRTNGPHRGGAIAAIALRSLSDSPAGAERKVTAPPAARLGDVTFAPDGKRLSFTHTRGDGVDLWIADVPTGQAKMMAAALNAANGDPCDWLANGVTLICHFIPANRGTAPMGAQVPGGPNVQETHATASPVATYQDLLKNAHDDRLFEYYFATQIAFVDGATGRRTNIGGPGLHHAVLVSPDGEYLLVSRNKRPFSRLVTKTAFPKAVEVWNRRGEVVRRIADLPLAENVPINGVATGPRAFRWRPDQPATLVWIEALDEGNPKNKVPHRDRVLALAAPFTGAPSELAKTGYRFSNIQWTEEGIALLRESDRATRQSRTWVLDGASKPRKLWERSQEARYGNPGAPVTRRPGAAGTRGGGSDDEAGDRAIIQHGDDIYLIGDGASPSGDRPFLDRLNLKTFATERLFRGAEKTYEAIVTLLSEDGTKILTRFETPADPPAYYVRDLGADTKRSVIAFKNPAPQLAAIERQFITYARKDGVRLSATLYLPPGYTKGTRLPTLMWAYPREFTDPDAAGQVSGSPNRFLTIGGASHLLLLLQGYAILDNPTMPIVGPGETANDTYVDQLVASAQAAVDKVVEMGVADRDRIAVGGHSYGAFMTANLLAHSDLFRAGIARSGAYNRSLTPFGFQNERRTFWEAANIYMRMSPFAHAHKMNEPILLIHGEADNNSGTFPIQSERFYMALRGHGATARYVTLPYESHGYAARESVLHTVAEMLNWCDRWVRGAAPRRSTTSAARRNSEFGIRNLE